MRPSYVSSSVVRAKLSLRKDDLYESPPEAVEALLKVESLPEYIWEPACGRGAIVNVLRSHGHQVLATDLVDYGCPDSSARIDFLMESNASAWRGAIVTNPPFKLANEFVRQALNLCPRVYFLLRLAFLESEGRSDILDGGHLARVYVFRNRLPMMHRDGYTEKTTTSAIAFAWFVWDKEHQGPSTIQRISWNALSPRMEGQDR